MRVSIYAYDNSVLDVKVPVDTVEQIKCIHVRIVSGDEIVTFTTTDNKQVTFDAYVDATGDKRYMDFDDGSYLISDPDKIREWINYKGDDNPCISYGRKRRFVNKKGGQLI